MSPSKGTIVVRRSSPYLLDDLGELLADDLALALGRGEDRVVLVDEGLQLVVRPR